MLAECEVSRFRDSGAWPAESFQGDPDSAKAVARGQFYVPAPGDIEANYGEEEIGNLIAEQQACKAQFILQARPRQAQQALEVAKHLLKLHKRVTRILKFRFLSRVHRRL